MQVPQDHYIQVGQVRTRYWVEGTGVTTVVLIHGLGGYVENWLSNFEVLASSYRVYAVDLLGHGQTEKPQSGSYGIDDLLEFVRNFMGALKIEHANLIGHSLGGAISLHLAYEFPDIVDKLLLVDSAGLGREVNYFPHSVSLTAWITMLARPHTSSAAAQSLRMAVADPSVVTDNLIEIECRMNSQQGSRKARLKTTLSIFNISGQRESFYGPIVKHLPFINQQALIIWGSRDPFLPVAHAQVAATRLPNASLRVFKGCGHLPFLEQPQAFNQMAIEFLD